MAASALSRSSWDSCSPTKLSDSGSTAAAPLFTWSKTMKACQPVTSAS